MERHQPPIADPEEVVTAYAGAVYRAAYAFVRSKSDAEDVFQEVFYRYFRAGPGLESLEHQRAWLLRVTANCAKKHLKSPWVRKRSPLPEELPYLQPAETGLAEALEKLSPLYRGVLHLYYCEGYQAEEIAKLLGRKPGTVRAQLTRARERLKNALVESEESGGGLC